MSEDNGSKPTEAEYWAALSVLARREMEICRALAKLSSRLEYASRAQWTGDQNRDYRIPELQCQKMAKQLRRSFHSDYRRTLQQEREKG
jgi:hypothetical protein